MLLIAFVFFVLLPFSINSMDCNISGDFTLPSVRERYANATLVIRGSVTSFFSLSTVAGGSLIVQLENSLYYKGCGKGIVQLTGFSDSLSSCRNIVPQINQSIIAFINSPVPPTTLSTILTIPMFSLNYFIGVPFSAIISVPPCSTPPCGDFFINCLAGEPLIPQEDALGNPFCIETKTTDKSCSSPVSPCSLPPNTATSGISLTRYAYNMTRGECVPFTWGGGFSEGNNFLSLKACQLNCSGVRPNPNNTTTNITTTSSTGPITLPTTTGTPPPSKTITPEAVCKQSLPAFNSTCFTQRILRFFYNSTSGYCESFLWDGCTGGDNSNNFEDFRECVLACGGSGCPGGIPLAPCLSNPCSGATCTSGTDYARCVTNYCGDRGKCFAEFYFQSRLVTCSPTPPPAQPPSPTPIPTKLPPRCASKDCVSCVREDGCGWCAGNITLSTAPTIDGSVRTWGTCRPINTDVVQWCTADDGTWMTQCPPSLSIPPTPPPEPVQESSGTTIVPPDQLSDCTQFSNCTLCLSNLHCGWCSFGLSSSSSSSTTLSSLELSKLIEANGGLCIPKQQQDFGKTGSEICWISGGFYRSDRSCVTSLTEVSVRFNQTLTIEPIQTIIDSLNVLDKLAIVVTVVTGARITYTAQPFLSSMIIFEMIGKTDPTPTDLDLVCHGFTVAISNIINIDNNIRISCTIISAASQKRNFPEDMNNIYNNNNNNYIGSHNSNKNNNYKNNNNQKREGSFVQSLNYVADIRISNSDLNSLVTSQSVRPHIHGILLIVIMVLLLIVF